MPGEVTVRWISRAVVVPFLVSRAAFALAIGLALRREPAPWVRAVPGGLARDLLRLPDALCQWDCLWYLNVVWNGYVPGAFAAGGESNIAFFPAYPWSVRLLYLALPGVWRTVPLAIVLAILLANLFAVAGLAVVGHHLRARFGEELAARAVLLLLAFPTSFFLSCGYTEGLFLLLAATAWHSAWRGRWAAAGAAGFLLALTRPNGMLFAAPAGWMYLESIGFSPRRLRPAVLWLALFPLGFVAYAAYLGSLTGDPLAVLHVQRAWGKEAAGFFRTVLDTSRGYGPMTAFDRGATLLFLGCAALMLRRAEHRAGAIAVLVTVAAFGFTGLLRSAARYVGIVFPVYAWFTAAAGERVGWAVAALCWGVQVALLLAYASGQWVA